MVSVVYRKEPHLTLWLRMFSVWVNDLTEYVTNRNNYVFVNKSTILTVAKDLDRIVFSLQAIHHLCTSSGFGLMHSQYAMSKNLKLWQFRETALIYWLLPLFKSGRNTFKPN